MFFTQEDFDKISLALKLVAKKDSLFEKTDVLHGNEYVVIVLNGDNKKVLIKDLINAISTIEDFDFVNVTYSLDISKKPLEEVIPLLPKKMYRNGLVITFLNDKDLWGLYQFSGTEAEWNTVDNWKDMQEYVDPKVFSAKVVKVNNIGLPNAKVTYDNTVFNFEFTIPKGDKGDKGDPGKEGSPGPKGESSVVSRTVLIFKSSQELPLKPVGGHWDVNSNEVTYPEGWSVQEENLASPVWMSYGEFLATDPDNPTWGMPTLVSGKDGKNGVDGESTEFIFKLWNSTLVPPDTPTEKTPTGLAPAGWTNDPSGITIDMKVEYVSTRKKNKYGSWDNWSKPSIWSKWSVDGMDGAGVEYIFKVNKGEVVENPTPEDTTTDEYQEKGEFENIEYVPTDKGWTDSPTGVTSSVTHEWVCIRKYKNNTWGAFSDPALWSNWSEDGINGESGISSRTMYAKTENSSVVPPVVADNINPGSIWGLAFPSYKGNEAVWSIQAYVTYKNELAKVTVEGEEVYGWLGPWILTGIKGKDGTPPNYKTYVYLKIDSKPDKPIGNDPENPGGNWVDYPNDVGLWWQCVGSVNGVDHTVVWGEVIPVNGKDGIALDGKFTEFRFAIGTSEVYPTLASDKRTPEGWNTLAPAKKDNEYIWLTTAVINPNQTLFSNWATPVKISGEQGPKGNTGPTGDRGPTGSLGLSGIPGVNIKAYYCLGTKDKYDATFNSTVANTLNPVSYGWLSIIPTVTEDKPYIWSIQTSLIFVRTEADPNKFELKLEAPWSNPFRITGVNGVGVSVVGVDEYYQYSTKSSGVTIGEGTWSKNEYPIWDSSKGRYLWNYEITRYSNGSFGAPTTPVLIGSIPEDAKLLYTWIMYADNLNGEGINSDPKGKKYIGFAYNKETSTPSKVPSQYTWYESKGDKGDTGGVGPLGPRGPQGNEGKGIAYIIEEYLVSKWSEGISGDEREWSTTILHTTSEAPYLWNKTTVVYTLGNPSVYLRIIGTHGAIGSKGQIVYPRGNYDVNVEYISTEKATPYVFDANGGSNGAFFILNCSRWKGSELGNRTPALAGEEFWTKMDPVEAIYTKVLVTPNALVGCAVFNGDYMFSQKGLNRNGIPDSTYLNFDSTNPYGGSYSNRNFTPNICFDLGKGKGKIGGVEVDGKGDLLIKDTDALDRVIITPSNITWQDVATDKLLTKVGRNGILSNFNHKNTFGTYTSTGGKSDYKIITMAGGDGYYFTLDGIRRVTNANASGTDDLNEIILIGNNDLHDNSSYPELVTTYTPFGVALGKYWDKNGTGEMTITFIRAHWLGLEYTDQLKFLVFNAKDSSGIPLYASVETTYRGLDNCQSITVTFFDRENNRIIEEPDFDLIVFGRMPKG